MGEDEIAWRRCLRLEWLLEGEELDGCECEDGEEGEDEWEDELLFASSSSSEFCPVVAEMDQITLGSIRSVGCRNIVGLTKRSSGCRCMYAPYGLSGSKHVSVS